MSAIFAIGSKIVPLLVAIYPIRAALKSNSLVVMCLLVIVTACDWFGEPWSFFGHLFFQGWLLQGTHPWTIECLTHARHGLLLFFLEPALIFWRSYREVSELDPVILSIRYLIAGLTINLFLLANLYRFRSDYIFKDGSQGPTPDKITKLEIRLRPKDGCGRDLVMFGFAKKIYQCDFCGVTSYLGRHYRHCAGCSLTHYCSEDHYRLHWPIHRTRCDPALGSLVNDTWNTVLNEWLPTNRLPNNLLDIRVKIINDQVLVQTPGPEVSLKLSHEDIPHRVGKVQINLEGHPDLIRWIAVLWLTDQENKPFSGTL